MNVLHLQSYGFFSAINIWGGKNTQIFDISFFSDRKVNVIGPFGTLKFKFPIRFWSVEEKNEGIMGIFMQNQIWKYLSEHFPYMVVKCS